MTKAPSSCHETDVALTGLSIALLPEIFAHLQELVEKLKQGPVFTQEIISLRGLPMTKEDIEDLDKHLGRGEVDAKVVIAGNSDIWETAYSGVWRVRHFSGDNRIIVDDVVIATIPEILIAHKDDISASVLRMNDVILGLQKDGVASNPTKSLD
jgi:hydrogenase-1 operon protein HyaF